MSIFNHFKHLNLSQGQETALTKLEAFLASPVQVFMLKGYAGSGKTTILKGLVEYLNAVEKDFALMAPTGRAAKVIREKTGQEAFTIHKSIYSYEDMVEIEEGDSFYYHYKIRNNVDVARKIFIVDEASLLSDAKSEGEFFRFGSSQLLSDLFTYTRVAQPNVNSKIIFVGDPCQLPPVGDNSSKAFEANYLKDHFNLSSEETEMKEVKRQGGDSGILRTAAKIRKSISAGFFNDFNLRSNGKDILNPTYETFLDTWQEAASPKIIIASKNKTCLGLNLQIRERRFGNADSPVQKSDIVIMGGNNYRKGVFNGEFAVINEVSDIVTQRTIALRGKNPVTLYWRDVELVFPDAESNNKIVKGKMLENFFYGDNYLKPEETQALYVDFTTRHKGLKPKTEEFKETIMRDEYFNCLLMKYGYAVTCHKAQGGEWDNVFTVWDNDNMEGFECFTDKQRKAGKTNQDFYRWAYTAITRASKTLYALNPPFFNSYSAMAFLDVTVLNALNELTGNQVQTEEISLDNELLQQLSVLNLLEQTVPLQDHFIKVHQAVRKQYIEIVGWEKIGYEIRYSFMKEQDKAVFRTYVNGQNEFRKPFASMPNFSPNSSFNNALAEILNHLPNVSIKRNTAETIISQIEFDFELEEEFPFTRSLFDDIVLLFKETDITIDGIEHQQYKERYTFKRNNETAVVDFEYKKNGFFGRVVPIQNMTNSQLLLSSIQTALQTFKKKIMPAKEIKELRQAGKLEEAYAMAKAELEADLSNIWGKRNLSWVLYAQLDELASNLDAFLAKIDELKELDLPASEEMFFENISIVISKAARVITHDATLDINKIHRLFDSIKELSLKRNSKWFSVLFNAMHKGMKESNRYIEFADWWDFKNFRPEDFHKEKMPNGKEVMAIAEQAYIAYVKHLLPKQTQHGEIIFNIEKAQAFLPVLSQIVEDYPQFQYPTYFNAKLLLALGDKDNMLESLLPFAKKKRNDFWVWEILAEAFSSDPEKVFACYCKALSCKGPDEMLVSLRQKMARILIATKRFNEARTEIDLLVHARTEHGFKIPAEVTNWQAMDWYKTAVQSKSNFDFYKTYVPIAEALLFSDVPEESVIVEFVNADKKILNFIASETRFGFFKYDRFFSDVKVGDTLKIRFQGGSNEGMHQLYTAIKVNDDAFKMNFFREVHGVVRIPAGKPFGFMDDVFIHPSFVTKYKLTEGMQFTGKAIKSFNQEKKQWGWKLI